MSMVVGQLGLQHPDALGLGFGQIKPGRFVFRQVTTEALPKHLIRQIPTEHECPYCHSALCQLDPAQGYYTGRVTTIVDDGVLVVDPLPENVMPLKCVECDVHFSVLRSGAVGGCGGLETKGDAYLQKTRSW